MPKPGAVLLLTGPAASGKTTLAQYLAQQLGWQAISEDQYWVRQRCPDGRRSPEQERVVQQQVLDDVLGSCSAGCSVVLEFILYAEPPNPVSAYVEALSANAVTFEVVMLKTSVAEILRRSGARGRPRDLDHPAERRQEAEHQVGVVESEAMRSWPMIDNTALSVSETYHLCVQRIRRLLE